MATAPFQLWVDLPSVSKAVRVSSTVTVTTTAAHGLTTGTYVQLEGFTGTAGTSMNGVFAATVTSGTTFTVTDSGTAGTATSGSAVVSRDLLSPVIDITSANRQAAAYVIPDSISMSAAGDGNSSSFGFQVAQDDTPSDGPWWANVPDQARVRLYKVATGTEPTDADLYFIGTIAQISASLNGSGQGSITDVTVDEVNAILDKMVVLGKPIGPAIPTVGGFVRAANVTTVTTARTHNYTTATSVAIAGVIGGNGNFNGTFPVLTPSGSTFTYSNSGTAGTGNSWTTPSSAGLVSGSKQIVVVAFTSPHYLSKGNSVTFRNFVTDGAKFTEQINATFSITKVTSGTAFQVTMPAPLGTAQNQTVTTIGQVKGNPTITPVGAQTAQQNFGVNAGWSEDTAVTTALTRVDADKSEDAAVQRLIKTSDISKIVGAGSDSSNQLGATIPASSLRSILDGIAEIYGGQDAKERRYWIGLDRKLNYVTTNAANKPTYANAPYKIITTGTQNPNTTAAGPAATLFPHSISVSYDHNTTKSALFNISSTGTAAISLTKTYTDVGYTERNGAPVFDDVVNYPTRVNEPSAAINLAARSYFLEQHLPLQTITFTLRGAGTAAHNLDGFSAGYYQTGASAFALQKRWEPGQWVSITCAELALSGLYRVEQVDWNLMPGSFFQEIRITANRRNPNNLVDIVKRNSK